MLPTAGAQKPRDLLTNQGGGRKWIAVRTQVTQG